MKKPEVYLKPVPKDIIDLAKDHTRMCTEIGNLLLLLVELSKDRDHHWLLNKSSHHSEVEYIASEIRRLHEENKELKESLKAVKNP